MPKRARLLDRPNAWAWVCDVAATEGLDLTRMSLFEAAQCAVSHLEHRRDAGLSLNPGAVKLASLLARLEGESAVSGAPSGDLFLERAYARDRARLLADRYAAGLRIWSRPARDSGSGTGTGVDALRSHSPL